MINIEELERLAREATPGMWKTDGIEIYSSIPRVGNKNKLTTILCCEEFLQNNDREFIAVANPATILALISALKTAREALEVIASKHKPRQETEEYWLKIKHEQCATVLATDTKIARNALTTLSSVWEGKKI